ncbi:hypothetical protein Tco_0692824 [Tanacetum coccineum]
MPATTAPPPATLSHLLLRPTFRPPPRRRRRLIRPTPKILPTSGSTQPTTSLPFTRHHHPHVTTNSHVTIIIIITPSLHLHRNHHDSRHLPRVAFGHYRDALSVVIYIVDCSIHSRLVSSLFEGLSDIGSPGVVGPKYEGLSWMLDDPYVQVVLQALPSPDYVPGPEEPEQAPPLPEFVPELVYLKFMPPEDESDPEEDPEKDDEEDPEEDPVNFPADGGDDGDDEDESSDDDEDDDVDIEVDEEEEEHQASADSIAVALPAVDPASSAEETKPFRLMSLRLHHHHILHTALLLGCPSEMRHRYHFLLGKRLRDFLPYHHLHCHHSPHGPMLRAAAPSTYILAPRSEAPPSGTPPLLPIPLPTPSPLLLLPSTDRRADVREACLPPQKRLCFAFGPGYKVGESSFAPTSRPDGDFRRDYGFITTLDDEIMRDPKRDDTDEIYGRLDDAQTERQMVTSRVNMLVRDRHAHARIARLMEIEASMSREAWGWSMDASDLICTEVMALRTQMVAQRSEIAELRAADRMRQTQLTEALKLMKTLQTQLTGL